MNIVLLTVGIVAVVMLAMAVGVILRGKCLSGSCGGPKVVSGDGKVVCGSCGRADTSDSALREIDFSEKP